MLGALYFGQAYFGQGYAETADDEEPAPPPAHVPPGAIHRLALEQELNRLAALNELDDEEATLLMAALVADP